MCDERIRAASEVSDVHRVQSGVFPYDLGRGHDLLARPPVHGLETGHVGGMERKEIHRDRLQPEVPNLRRKIHAHTRIAGVIIPPDEHERLLARLYSGQDRGAPLFDGPVKCFLCLPREPLRPANCTRAFPESRTERLHTSGEMAIVLEIQYRFYDLGAAEPHGSSRNVWQSLRIGTGLRIIFTRVKNWEPYKTRQEKDVHLFIEKVLDMSERDLGWEARLSDRGLEPPVDQRPVRAFRKHNMEAEFCKKGLPERQIVVYIEHPRDTDAKCAIGCRPGEVGARKQLLAL